MWWKIAVILSANLSIKHLKTFFKEKTSMGAKLFSFFLFEYFPNLILKETKHRYYILRYHIYEIKHGFIKHELITAPFISAQFCIFDMSVLHLKILQGHIFIVMYLTNYMELYKVYGIIYSICRKQNVWLPGLTKRLT